MKKNSIQFIFCAGGRGKMWIWRDTGGVLSTAGMEFRVGRQISGLGEVQAFNSNLTFQHGTPVFRNIIYSLPYFKRHELAFILI